MDPALRPPSPTLRLCRLLLRGAGAVLPRSSRRGWRESWEGELWHRWHELALRRRLSFATEIDLLATSLGAFSHALWLAGREWRSEPMLQDLRYALRQILRAPSFAAVAIASLALGIGANTVIFSVVDGALLHPFPYPEVDRLVALGVTFPKLEAEETFVEAMSDPELTEVETQSRTLRHLLAFDLGNRDLGGVDVPQRLFSAFLWHDAFPTLGMRPALGRGFTREEIAGQEPVAIISFRVWRERFGGDPSVVGRSVLVNGLPRTVVGVMPPGLSLFGTDLWMPMWAPRGDLPREQRQLTVLARLAPGASLQEANAELAALAGRTEQEHGAAQKEYEGWRLAATPFLDVWASFVGRSGFILLGAVGLVLLIACANLASLLLARAAGRESEFAVRTALGAPRRRLVRQLLVESLLLAVGGGLLGLLLAWAGLDAAVAFLPLEHLPGDVAVSLSGRVLAFTSGLAVACGLLFGIAPALRGARVELSPSLSASRSAGGSRRAGRLHGALVVAEIALALMLMVGAGLLSQSFVRLRAVEPGVELENVLTMRLTLPWERYRGAAVVGFFERLAERVAAIPGVRSVAVASQFPPMGFGDSQFWIEGQEPVSEDQLPTADVTIASPELFATLGVPLRSGRLPSPLDDLGTPGVLVVNETFVRKFLPGGEPLGRRIRFGSSRRASVGPPDRPNPQGVVVGVVADSRNRGLDQPVRPEVFIPLRQSGGSNNQLFLLLRTETEAAAFLPLVRDAVRTLDPNQPVYAIHTLEEAFSENLFERRLASAMMTVFAAGALLLAVVGVYGALSQRVAARTRELGIRLALGAERESVLALVVRQAALLMGLGLAIGVAGSLAAGRALGALLYEVRPGDPWNLAVVAGVLAAAGLAAGYLPARRAARLDPVRTLRQE